MSSAAPDFAAPIVGWRAWVVVGHESAYRLASVAHPTVWEPRAEVVGECLAVRRWLPFRRRASVAHDAPLATCSCGIYASTDAELAGMYVFADAYGRRRKTVARVIGLVSLWGRVLACKRGWRSEFAYPAHLVVPTRANDARGARAAEEIAAALAADYLVPTEIVAHRHERDLVRALS